MLFILVSIILASCLSKNDLGRIGNYQVVLEKSKADFFVLMLPTKQKIRKDKIYASYSNNKIQYTRGIVLGKALHGAYKEIDFDGAILVAGGFKKGLRNGYWSFYDSYGNLTKDLTYKLGDTTSLVSYYNTNGSIKESLTPSSKKKRRKKSLLEIKNEVSPDTTLID